MHEYIMESDPTFVSIEAFKREILSFVFCEVFIKEHKNQLVFILAEP